MTNAKFSLFHLDVADYCLYLITLGSIFGIIWYYNVTVRKKYDSVYGFLFGGKDMSVLSISLALTASHLTGITLLGIPVEIYLRGTQYLVASSISLVIVSALTALIYLPVFYRLQLSSSFEYLEIRFSPAIRCFAAIVFIVSKLMILAIVPYIPLMAFKQETEDVSAKIIAMVSIICGTLTAIAGLRAIVALGFGTVALAVFGTVLPSALGVSHLGLDRIWQIASYHKKIAFYESDQNVLKQTNTSFYIVTLALTTNWLWKIALSQQSMQKLLAVNTIAKARIALMVSCVVVILMKLLSCFLGLVVFAWLSGLELQKYHEIKNTEQLVPYFLSKLSNHFPGTYHIFRIAIFVASTGCIASTINSVSGVIFEEVLRPRMPQTTNESNCCRAMKILCIVVGGYIALIIGNVENLDRLQHVASSVTGIAAGTLLGLFTLGIVFTNANYVGAMCGCIVSLLVCTILIICAKYSAATSSAKSETLFRIAFNYCPFVGAALVLLIGYLMSYFTGKSKTDIINPDVFCPPSQHFLPKSPTRPSNGSLSSSEARSSVREATEKLYVALTNFKQSTGK